MNLPNKLTIARVIAVPVFIVFYLMGWSVAAFVVFSLASITDTLDGNIARKRNLVTNFGKIMDPLADKILVYSALCLFVETGVIKGWMLIVILAREFVVAGLRTVAASNGIVIAAGVSGKIKTVLQMIAVLLLILGKYWIFGVLGQIFMWASLVMTVYSGAEYVIKNVNVFKG